MPATIVFASFTGEEAGLLGSREFVRRAVADKMKIVGALNNDMIGWANDHRLDNTIRYSNPGIRDIQHGAAMQFTQPDHLRRALLQEHRRRGLLRAYGDIVGGIGSYPVLGNPHYHQSHDLLETINHQLDHRGGEDDGGDADAAGVEPVAHHGPEGDRVGRRAPRCRGRRRRKRRDRGYLVAWGPPNNPALHTLRRDAAARDAARVSAGTVVAVKAINAKGHGRLGLGSRGDSSGLELEVDEVQRRAAAQDEDRGEGQRRRRRRGPARRGQPDIGSG